MSLASVHLTGIYDGGLIGFIASLAGAAWGAASWRRSRRRSR